MFVNVAFPIASYQEFTYSVPAALEKSISVGSRVSAKLGKRQLIGLVVAILKETKFTGSVKPVDALVDDQPVLNESLWHLIQWMSRYYMTPIGQAVKTALPDTLSTKYQPPTKWVVNIKSHDYDILELEKRAPTQAQVLKHLEQLKEPVPVTEFNMLASSPLTVCRNLADKNLVSLEEVMELPDITGFTFNPIHKEIVFSEAQHAVISSITDSIQNEKFKPYLLHGVTASGKTEIYIDIAHKTLDSGRSVIILLPEIALTPQIAGRFRAVFGDKVALWHSKLSAAARAWTWKGICRGDFNVVIGARSAVFTPLNDLGLIVVDEEQESSFKQDSLAPRYHARDVALMRGKLQKAAVVLASATPSFESYYNQLHDKFSYFHLQERFGGARYPHVKIVDMLKEQEESGKFDQIFSGLLLDKIDDRLKKNEQILLLQNRRGFAPILRCHDCGSVVMCKNCQISMTYHIKGTVLQCHYCGHSLEKRPEQCDTCGSPEFDLQGTGTQKVEELIKENFPKSVVARLDVDSVRTGKNLVSILKKFEKGDINILLGTKMIAKGLDFKNVTLVGIINADTGLYLPDFRSGERVFQLIYQAAGRAGREKKPGEVIVQTYSIDDPVIKYATRLDLKSYYNIALNQRQELNYPPFSWLAKIEFTGLNKTKVEQYAKRICAKLPSNIKGMEVLGPAWCYREKLRNRFRMQLVIKSYKQLDTNGYNLHSVLNKYFLEAGHSRTRSGIKTIIDVDPTTLL
ncbi:primosomal protein N' [Candidatus Neomarinimicrobiota bacterium]